MTHRELWEAFWSAARICLRLTEPEFYELTPHQFYVLMDARAEQVEHQELLAGIIASATANFGGMGRKKPTCPADFMPSQHGKQKNKRQRANPRKVDEGIRGWLDQHRALGHVITTNPQNA